MSSFKPNSDMIASAKRGLKWRKEYGRGGTQVGVSRARDISNGKSLPLETVKRMHSYFSRHEIDKEAEGFREGEKGFPSAGRIAWELWGGDSGKSWAASIVKKHSKDSAIDVVSEPSNDIFNVAFEYVFPSVELLDKHTQYDRNAPARRRQGSLDISGLISKLIHTDAENNDYNIEIYIEPDEDTVSDISSYIGDLDVDSDMTVRLCTVGGDVDAYDIATILRSALDADVVCSYASSSIGNDGGLYHLIEISNLEKLLNQIDDNLGDNDINIVRVSQPSMRVRNLRSMSDLVDKIYYEWSPKYLCVDDGENVVRVKIDGGSAEREASWNLGELVSTGLQSSALEDINQRFTNENKFEDARGRMASGAESVTIQSGISAGGHRGMVIYDGLVRVREYYNLDVPDYVIVWYETNEHPILEKNYNKMLFSNYDKYNIGNLHYNDSVMVDMLSDIFNKNRAKKQTGKNVGEQAVEADRAADFKSPYSQGDGPMGVRFEDVQEKGYNIVKGASTRATSVVLGPRLSRELASYYRMAKIIKRKNKWLVTDSSGDKVLGEHKTKEDAKKQLSAIEISKRKRSHDKGAVGIIDGPSVNENEYGSDFSRADMVIPRPRSLDKLVHRK